MKCYAYARVSTDTEEQDTSYKAQLKYFNNWAESNGYELIKVYSDKESGTSVFKRVGLLEMLNNCGVILENNHFTKTLITPPINTIILKNTSRLSRNLLDAIEICRLLKENNVNVIFIENNLNTADTSSTFMLSLLQLFDEQVSRDISSKVRQGYIMQAKTTNEIHSNSRLYGYVYKNRKLTIIEDEAKVIQTIYKLYIDGYGIRRIQNYLREHNILTRNGKEFGKTTILNILTNEKYYGCNNRLKYKATGVFATTKTVKLRNKEERQYKDSTSIDPIITKEEFDKVQSILESRRGNKVGVNHGTTVFAGKIVCGKCESSYSSNIDRGRRFYNCTNKHIRGKKYCDNKNISEAKLTSLINEYWLRDCLQRIKLLQITKIRRGIDELKAQLNIDSTEEIDILEAQLNEIYNKKEKLLDLYLDGSITKSQYNIRLDKMTNEERELSERLNILKAPIETVREVIRGREVLIKNITNMEIKENYTLDEILSFISKLIIVDNEIQVIFNIDGQEFDIGEIIAW